MDTTPTAGQSAAGISLVDVSPLKALGGLLLLLPLLLLPVVVLWFAGRGVLEEHSRLASYRTVNAVVLATNVERRPQASGHGAPSYVPRVLYRYVVDGTVYHAQWVTPRDVGGTAGWARRHAAEYMPGQRVTAYYDPRSPGRAFLDRRGMPALTATFFLPAPILAFAVIMAAGARARRLARRRPPAQPEPAPKA